jgi:1-acyl-sn-glycerol-3-phosphate acyltransferase
MIAGAGTLFIERESNRDVMRVVHHMKEALDQNDLLMVFPEGTTSTGESVLTFHGNLIQAAISANCPIQSIALQYLEKQAKQPPENWQLSKAVPYVGDDSLLGSVWRIAQTKTTYAQLYFALPQWAEGRSRREWAHDLQQQVVQHLGEIGRVV